MGLLQFRVTIDRPLAGVFAVYVQPATFRWCSFIRSTRWDNSEPWKEESRLLIEIGDPLPGVVDQVLTRFEPDSRVDFISHFSGITMMTRVSFRAVSEDQTEISVSLEFVGTLSRVVGFAIEPAIDENTRRFFDDLKRACEKTIPQTATRAANPGSIS
jgi:hypothetical protein